MKRAILSAAVLVAMLFTFACKSSDTSSEHASNNAQKQWDAPIGEVNFQGITLKEALDDLQASASDGELDVQWESLKLIGLERDTLVTLQLKEGVPASKVLALLLQQYKQLDPYNPPVSRIVDGVMVVTLKGDLEA